VPVRVVRDTSELGPQEFVFITLKAHQVESALPALASLLGKDTTVIPPTTGLPYWFFADSAGQWAGRKFSRLDPQDRQQEVLGPHRALGCAFWVGVEMLEPGVVRHDGEESGFPIGEPNGTISARLELLHEFMTDSGLRAPMRRAIRSDIWIKMVNSVVWNPIAVLTRATLGDIGMSKGVVATAMVMMRELDGIASVLGVPVTVTVEKRIASTLANVGHRMSMLQDLLRGRPLELFPLVNSVAEIKDMTGRATPTTDVVLSFAELAEVSATKSCERWAAANH
jgi:2-dehydropantoate 2-reductase